MKLALEVQDVSKVYGDGTKALDRVSLDVKEGEILALLGENGAGKTTLIGTICGMVQPSSGKILATTPLLPWRPAILSPTVILRLLAI